MNYRPSLILQLDTADNQLESVVHWLNQLTRAKLTPETIQNQPDITLINQAGESIKIETIRNLKEQLAYGAYGTDKIRYFIFLNAHLATIPAQNALLKSIEEPPANTQIVLVTHAPEKLLETIRSRCQLVVLRSSDLAETANFLEIEQLYFKIVSANHGQKITLAADYKERDAALQVCTKMLTFLHSQLRNPHAKLSTKQITHNAQTILKTIEYLESNVNVLLALENCFFELV